MKTEDRYEFKHIGSGPFRPIFSIISIIIAISIPIIIPPNIVESYTNIMVGVVLLIAVGGIVSLTFFPTIGKAFLEEEQVVINANNKEYIIRYEEITKICYGPGRRDHVWEIELATRKNILIFPPSSINKKPSISVLMVALADRVKAKTGRSVISARDRKRKW